MLVPYSNRPPLYSNSTEFAAVSVSETDRCPRVLSLDGGGARGLSSLLILRGIMEEIGRRRSVENPLPCHYFDLIGGSGMGGIIAIMLGRLRMAIHNPLKHADFQSVEECIEEYMELSTKVFIVDQVLMGVVPVGDDHCRFDYKQLELALKNMVKKKLHNEGALMTDGSEQLYTCPTFVVATKGFNADGPPTLFRSYKCEGFNPSKCAIWEVGRATSAAPSFFKPMFIPTPSPGGWFVDGGISHNNPSELVLREAERIWPTLKRFCLVSIGAGRQKPIKVVGPSDSARGETTLDILAQIPWVNVVSRAPAGIRALNQIMEACVQLATNSEGVHQRILRSARSFKGDELFLYHRFNVEHGMESVGLEEWRKLVEMAGYTEGYMEEGEGEMKKNRCAQDLMAGTDVNATDSNGQTALLWAAFAGDRTAVQLLLELGSDVNAKSVFGVTPLIAGALSGNDEIARVLLEAGGDIHTLGHEGNTILHTTARYHEGTVRLLLENGADVFKDEKNDLGLTALLIAVCSGNVDGVRALLEKGADTEPKTAEGWTVLHCSCTWDSEAIAVPPKAGDDVVTKITLGTSALQKSATVTGRQEIVRLLLDNGVKVNAKRLEDGRTALHLAVKAGDKEIVRLLVQNGADVNAIDTKRYSPLILAAIYGHEEIALLLLEKRAKVDNEGVDGTTALAEAVAKGNEGVVRLLLERGARDRYIVGTPGGKKVTTTALHLAATTARPRVVGLLLERSPDIDERNSLGQTALAVAIQKGDEAVVRLLLEKGANVRLKYTAPTGEKLTMLHQAAWNGNEKIVRLLLDKGADISGKNSRGQTALALANARHHTAVVQTLQEYGNRKGKWFGLR